MIADLNASHSHWEPTAKFIVIKPDELHQSPELFVSNNPDDGYDLTFQSLAEFEVWRQQEEEMHTIEFIRGDSHGSRSNPPRFKEHVKLVCARHSRRGRKQYVKKYPERVRKLPNRKIHGIGCSASICYKTYVNTSVVRVMYRQEHSHPTGPENLVFTKKGRRILAQHNPSTRSLVTPSPSTSSRDLSSPETPQFAFPSSPRTSLSDVTSSSQELPYSTAVTHDSRTEEMGYDWMPNQLLLEQPFNPHELQLAYLEGSDDEAPIYQPLLHAYGSASASHHPPEVSSTHTHARWDRLAALFRSVCEHACSNEHPQGPPDILEEVLVQLYLGLNPLEAALNSQEDPGPGAMERSPMEVAQTNPSRELIHPIPVRNACLSIPELFGEVFPTHMTGF
ncbi:hypothetical protein V565_153100 [Rhizoctonia solani 123E]|uniref:Uncharacterized protein n=1 Tax=Rhizoctonia solani 123E TaxID=1423351 RepID=A0A074RK77_9AGAM|nr:hypothetical protein V565_153100 [Rhizoctonia solani 123E]